MTVSDAIERAVKIVGSEAKLGQAAGGFSQNAVWQAKRRNRISPELALGIHRATDGEVCASELRPDIWATPDAVPTLAQAGEAA